MLDVSVRVIPYWPRVRQSNGVAMIVNDLHVVLCSQRWSKKDDVGLKWLGKRLTTTPHRPVKRPRLVFMT